jgi:hypothetical protein
MDTRPESPAQAISTAHPKDSKQWGMSMWDESNPYAMVNRLPEEIKKKLLAARDAMPDLFKLDDKSLMKEIKARALKPLSVLDNRLRVSLWMEYDRSISQNRLIFSSVLYNGFCTEEIFYTRLMDPHRVAWIFSPPAKYEKLIEEALTYGLEQLRMVLEEDNYKENGKLDLGLMKLKMQIVVMLDQRQKGGYVQRMEEKKVQLNLNQGIVGSDLGRITSMTELDNQIKDMELRLQKANVNLPAPETIDVQVIEQVKETKVPGEEIPAFIRYPGIRPDSPTVVAKKRNYKGGANV